MISAFPAGVPDFGAMNVPQMFSGKAQCVFCDVVNGNDGNDGLFPSSPVKTIAKGYSLLRNNQHDTLFLIGLGTAFTVTTPLVWAKNYAHLVGISAPIAVAGRARVTSGSADIAAAIQVTGTGCIFRNVQIANFSATNTTGAGVDVTGQRCYFGNCHIIGMGGAGSAASTLGRSLTLTGGSENTFEDCSIGLDTVDRSAANFEMELTAQATRNYFNRCNFLRRTTTVATGAFINIPASGMDRWLLLRDPAFLNFIIGGGLALNVAIFNNAASGGVVMLKNALSQGCTKISTTNNVFADNAYATATVGLGVNPS